MRSDLMLDNIDVAVLTKVNELAERYGLKPYDFLATFKHDGKDSYVLEYEMPASNGLREVRFDKMLTAIGIAPDGHSAMLTGSTMQIIDALDNAIEHAPRPRSSHRTTR